MLEKLGDLAKKVTSEISIGEKEIFSKIEKTLGLDDNFWGKLEEKIKRNLNENEKIEYVKKILKELGINVENFIENFNIEDVKKLSKEKLDEIIESLK